MLSAMRVMLFLLLGFIGTTFALSAAEPLRIFIRSGPKSHGPGDHDYPAFLRDWVPLLNAAGAKASGGQTFPTAEQLAETDVLIIHRQVGGDFKPEEKALVDAYAKRGGGFVVIHAATLAGDDATVLYYKDLIGGSWRHKVTKWKEGPMQLRFTDRDSLITRAIADFGMKDEIYYDMDLRDDIRALAVSPTPKKKGDGFEEQTQIWTYEKPGAQRAFVFVPGHTYTNFSRSDVKTILLRGIAWAGKRKNLDEFTKPNEAAAVLRPEGNNAPVVPKAVAKKDAPKGPATLPLPPGAAKIEWSTGTKVLLIGGGSSHDFHKFFNLADVAMLKAAKFSVNYTESPLDFVEHVKTVDVLVLSVNTPAFTTPAVRKALFDHVAAGKGVVLLHAGVWYNYRDWPEYNRELAGGGSRGHDRLGEYEVKVSQPDHPLLKGVPASFRITDELYYFEPDAAGTPIEVLATAHSAAKGKDYPQLFIVKHPKARIVGLTLGHDARAHSLPAYQQLLQNAILWTQTK